MSYDRKKLLLLAIAILAIILLWVTGIYEILLMWWFKLWLRILETGGY